MKKVKILLIALILILSSILFNQVNAINLKVQPQRPFNAEDDGNTENGLDTYRFLRRGGVTGLPKGYAVFKIYEENDTEFRVPYYCLRGRVGFGATEEYDYDANSAVAYTKIGEMHDDAASIISAYNENYSEINDGNVNISNKYNEILWILDNIYLPKDNEKGYNAEEYKTELFDKVGLSDSQREAITDDDIEVIQQLAIWYFSNYDENSNDNLSVSRTEESIASLLGFFEKDEEGNEIIDNEHYNNNMFEEQTSRGQALNKLYKYFIDGANENASNYGEDNSRNIEPISRDFDESLTLTIENIDLQDSNPARPNPENHYYKVGPFKIGNNQENIIPVSDITILDRSGEEITEYSFLDEDDEPVNRNELHEGTVYYIKVLKVVAVELEYDMSKVTLKTSGSYWKNTSEIFKSEENPESNQIVVNVDKELIELEDEITVKSQFDLSLRKFIKGIKRGNTDIEFSSRAPQINITTLLNGRINEKGETEYTATYTHPKNPLPVETDDVVTYAIRVYNEGTIDGTATEVTDYLPNGLEYITDSEINERYGWTVSEDGKTLTTDYLKDTTIKAFDKTKTIHNTGDLWQLAEDRAGGLYYAELQVECKVVARPEEQEKTLRNIAAITEDTDEDRDSIPESPDLDNYNPGEDNSTYQEDDDDYEDLKLRKGEFDLSLRKFINTIDGSTVEPSREPVINTTTLVEGRENESGEIEYTATYTHPKNKLTVKNGNIVVYTIRVYNEGELDGTATEVTDYLPSGLEYITDSEINQRYGWTVSEDGKTLTTDYLKDTIIKAFDITKEEKEEGEIWQKASAGNSGLYYADLQVECKVNVPVSGNETNLRNIAAITEDTDEDRDSVAGQPDLDNYNPGEDNSTYQEDDDDYEDLVVPGKVFDLALRKYISKLERAGEEITIANARSQSNIDKTDLINGNKTTAEYKHLKSPVEVETGDVVTYTFKVYNEGEVDGYVTKITDYLPEGLEFVENLNESEEYKYTVNENEITIEAKNGGNLFEKINAFDGETLESKEVELRLRVVAEVINTDKVLTNVATMTYGSLNVNIEDRDSKGEEFTRPNQNELPDYKGNSRNKDNLADEEYHYEGQQDDDDFEKVVLKGKKFDLSLRKYIAKINGEETENSREPQIDTSNLNKVDNSTGIKTTTATYIHSKEPLVVKKGDIITYKIRIYNEGQRDGYATKVTDYLPDGLGFLYTANGDINSDWFLTDNLEIKPLFGENGIYESEEQVLKKEAYKKAFGDEIDLANVQIIQGKANEDETRDLLEITAGGTIGETEIKATDLIKAYGSEKAEGDLWQQSINNENDGLFYQELEITCIVLKENSFKGILKNVAEITAAEDSNGVEIKAPGDDRDSEPNNVYEDNEHNPGTEIDGYTPGEQDDDDFEPLILQCFDLALRKFITNVESNGDKEEIKTRIPTLKLDDDGKIQYEHSKDPVYVANGDIVTYTIRVYNEGTVDGYAEEVTDDLPEGLEYLPEDETNKTYGWKMIDKEGNITEDVKEAVKVITDHLSSEKEKTGEDINNLIKAFDSSKALSDEDPLNPDYRDVKIAFRVIEPSTSNRIITNKAQISEDSDDDEDSIPDEWNEGEDDQDEEHIYVKYFDLSLLKWVTKTIVTVDGKTTITETGFKPNTGKTETTGIRENDEPEPIAKVELDKKKLNKTTVKFAYKIRVTNEGEIEGYATEITDFIPEGLEFNEEDNKEFGWVKEGDDKVTTRALETKLLKPGESAEVSITFTWKNNADNLGLKTNIAEITEDYNTYNSEDIDSTPDNKKEPYEKEQEDDDDFALVILSLETGKGVEYTAFIISMVVILATGIYLVKKYVLTY